MKKIVKLLLVSVATALFSIVMMVSASADVRTADDDRVYFEEDGLIYEQIPEKYSNGDPIYSLSEIKDPNSFLYQNSPTTGDVKALVFLVDFADYRNSSFTQQQVSDVLNNAEAGKDNYPFDSVSAYYDRSSFGKLNLSFDVYGWYNFSHNRSYYFDELSYNDTLQEILDAYDEEIDYSQYDANNDGYIDLIYLMYTGPDEGFGSAWWSYVIQAPTHIKNDGESALKYAVINLQQHLNVQTIAHETGHLFGLEDYYNTHIGFPTDAVESGGLGYYDLMDSNTGDHNIFSKLLLGWAEPVFVTSNTDIDVSAVSGNGAKAIIVTPENKGILSEYYIVEYYKQEKNNIYSPRPYKNEEKNGAVRIYHVDASIEGSSYKYNNTTSEHKLIKLVEADNTNNIALYDLNQYNEKYYYEEMTFGINTAPSTEFYGGKFTGINITVNTLSSNNANISVSFDVSDEISPYVINTKFQDIFGKYTHAINNYNIYFNSDIYPSDNFSNISVYKKNTNKSVSVIPSIIGGLNEIEGSLNKYNVIYLVSSEILDTNSQYILTIPENAVKDSYGNQNELITITVESLPENNSISFSDKYNIKVLPDNAPTGQTILDNTTKLVYAGDKTAAVQLLGDNTTQTVYEGMFVFKVFDEEANIALNKCISSSVDFQYGLEVFRLGDDNVLICGINEYIILNLNGTLLSGGVYFDDNEYYPFEFAHRDDAIDVYKHSTHQVLRIFFDGSTERFTVTDNQIYSYGNPRIVNYDYTELISTFMLPDKMFETKYNYVDPANYVNNVHSNYYNDYNGMYYAAHYLFRSCTPGTKMYIQHDVTNKLLISNGNNVPVSEARLALIPQESLGISPLSDGGYMSIIRCRMNTVSDSAHNSLQWFDSTLERLYFIRMDKELNVIWTYLTTENINFISSFGFCINNEKLYWITDNGTYVFDDIASEPSIKHKAITFSDDNLVFDAEDHIVISSDKMTASELIQLVSGSYNSITVYDMNGKIVSDSTLSLNEAMVEIEVDTLYTDYYHFSVRQNHDQEIDPETFDITDADTNVGSADISSEGELSEILTAKDSDADHIKLVVEENKSVTSEIENTISDIISEKSEVGFYLKIDLKKYIGTSESGKITETAKPVEIRMELPVILKNTDTTVAREYSVVRIHGGVAEILEVDFDGVHITFQTDRFSDYAIVYTDLPYGDVNGDGNVNMADLLLLKQYMVKVPGKTVYKAAADVNADNNLNMADLLRMKQYMVKVPGITIGKTS